MSDWLPAHATPTLSGTEVFCTDGDRLIRVVENYWSSPDAPGRFHLDDWQKWLIRHVLERYPCGECDACIANGSKRHPEGGNLRFRQVVISMGRQNGKSVLGGIFGFYGLAMHEYGPEVVGLARSREQANIIYERVIHVVNQSPKLRKQYGSTETQGIKRRKGYGKYVTKPANADAIQGFPMSMCLFDELHVSKESMWTAALAAMRTKKNGMLLGFTTAGDDTSTLLKNLYKRGEEANVMDQDSNRFGFFVWQAPEGSTIDDDEAVMAANPSVACGRISLETVRTDALTMPETDQQRYVLNLFVASRSNWLPMHHWQNSAGGGVPRDFKGQVVFAVDTTSSDNYATITATVRVDENYYTEVVASLVQPTPEDLITTLTDLKRKASARGQRAIFTMDSMRLKDVGARLKDKSFEVYVLSASEVQKACARAYALIVTGKVSHANDDLLRYQNPRAVRKNINENWAISRKDSSVDIDAVMATVMGLYISEKVRKEGPSIFTFSAA